MAWICVRYPLRRRSLRRHDDCVNAQSHNVIHSHFYKLPAELLDMVNRYLHFKDAMSLVLTCAQFYHSSVLMGVRRKIKSNKTARFQVLCMLEDDKRIKGYCCRGCWRRHSSASFSQDEIEKRAGERYCLLTKKCLNLGGLFHLSFVEAEAVPKMRMSNFQPRPSAARFKMRFFSPAAKCCGFLRVYPTRVSVSKDNFVRICRKLNCPLCPHIWTINAEIAELFPPEKSKSLKCQHCRTKITLKTLSYFHLEGDDYWCVLVTQRYFGRFISPLEPAWLAQTFASCDPNMGSYIHAAHRWNNIYWEQPVTILNRSMRLAPEDVTLFQPVTLPHTPASRAARRGVQALSVVQRLIPECVHEIFS